ncbi:MAG: hypothetical protein ACL93V_04985 [Candidatus Electrothrix sp. YB6]
MRFDDTNWVQVGEAGFSTDKIHFPRLAFSSDGTPYIGGYTVADMAYEAGKASVMKFVPPADAAVQALERR